MALNAGTRLGSYEIVSPLGEGGMGEVYRARDTRLDRTVAIKVLPEMFAADPERLARFEREAKSVAQLSHPNILNIFDFGSVPAASSRDRGVTYAVMELLEGETLAERLAHGPVPPRKAIEYGVQIASGLAAAHGRGIVHRDVKPANLFITHDERVKILDFGLAKPIEFGGADVTAAGRGTAAGLVMGTVGYMAPEQVRAQTTDHRTDLFAFGAVLYEMVSGRRAFRGDSPADAMSAILNSDPPELDTTPGGLPPALDRIIRRCLEKKPELRFQSAQDLAFALETLSSRSSGATTVGPSPARTRQIPAALPWILAGLAAVAASWWAIGRRATAPEIPSGELRLSIVPPVGHQFAQDASDFNPEFAVSPDGRRIVFVAVDGSGVSSLWVRDLASVTPRQLAGTTGAARAFWSADGRHVVFLTDAGLARVSIDGGAPQGISTGRITPALNSNLAWGAAGTIMFEANVTEERRLLKRLYMVPEAGGTAAPVARDSTQPTEQAQRFPVFLPDGRRFLYLSWTPDPAERGIFLGSTDGGVGRLLVKAGFGPAFVAPDVLLYIKDSALVAQRFSATDATLVGEPRTVVEGLALEAIPGGASFTVSPSGVVAYRSRSRDLASELRWVTRQGRVEPPSVTASDITVTLSPDGRRAALTRVLTTSSRDDRFPSNVWLFDLLRGVSSRLTLDANATDENPLWSADGANIAYAAHFEGGLAEVYVQPAMRSGNARLAASGPENFHPIDWARDGTLLLHAYATGGGSDDIDLWVLGAEPGAKPRPFIQEPANQAQGQFSPDGRWVAYTSDESGRQQVYARAFPSGNPRVQISSEGGGQPRWRADGGEIFYVSPTGTIMGVPVTHGDQFTPGVPVQLFTESSLKTHNNVFFYGGGAAYDVSADGQRFLVSRLTVEPSAGPIHVVINAPPLARSDRSTR